MKKRKKRSRRKKRSILKFVEIVYAKFQFYPNVMEENQNDPCNNSFKKRLKQLFLVPMHLLQIILQWLQLKITPNENNNVAFRVISFPEDPNSFTDRIELSNTSFKILKSSYPKKKNTLVFNSFYSFPQDEQCLQRGEVKDLLHQQVSLSNGKLAITSVFKNSMRKTSRAAKSSKRNQSSTQTGRNRETQTAATPSNEDFEPRRDEKESLRREFELLKKKYSILENLMLFLRDVTNQSEAEFSEGILLNYEEELTLQTLEEISRIFKTFLEKKNTMISQLKDEVTIKKKQILNLREVKYVAESNVKAAEKMILLKDEMISGLKNKLTEERSFSDILQTTKIEAESKAREVELLKKICQLEDKMAEQKLLEENLQKEKNIAQSSFGKSECLVRKQFAKIYLLENVITINLQEAKSEAECRVKELDSLKVFLCITLQKLQKELVEQKKLFVILKEAEIKSEYRAKEAESVIELKELELTKLKCELTKQKQEGTKLVSSIRDSEFLLLNESKEVSNTRESNIQLGSSLKEVECTLVLKDIELSLLENNISQQKVLFVNLQESKDQVVSSLKEAERKLVLKDGDIFGLQTELFMLRDYALSKELLIERHCSGKQGRSIDCDDSSSEHKAGNARGRAKTFQTKKPKTKKRHENASPRQFFNYEKERKYLKQWKENIALKAKFSWLEGIDEGLLRKMRRVSLASLKIHKNNAFAEPPESQLINDDMTNNFSENLAPEDCKLIAQLVEATSLMENNFLMSKICLERENAVLKEQLEHYRNNCEKWEAKCAEESYLWNEAKNSFERMSRTIKRSNTSHSSHYYGKTSPDEICYESVEGYCQFEESGCERLHSAKHFHWQVQEDQNKWVNFLHKEVIVLEAAFCDPGQDKIELPLLVSTELHPTLIGFRSLDNGGNKWVVDFNQMELIQTGTPNTWKVRRLYTKKYPNKTASLSKFIWYFFDSNGKWVEYGCVGSAENPQLKCSSGSEQIEKHYRCNKKKPMMVKNAKFSYNLDFVRWMQTNTLTEFQRKIKRRPKPHLTEKEKAFALADFPPQWHRMLPHEWLERVQLDINSAEYEQVNNYYVARGGNFSVISIERIQNVFLWRSFQNKIEEITFINNDDRNAANVQQLFHGTKAKVVGNICKENFDWRLSGSNEGQVYGRGTYFSSMASVSCNFAPPDSSGLRFIFVAKVAVGSLALGDMGMIRPPYNPLTKSFYDSTTDDVLNPTKIVKYEKNEYYPEYILTLK